jgi:hypothetical protein
MKPDPAPEFATPRAPANIGIPLLAVPLMGRAIAYGHGAIRSARPELVEGPFFSLDNHGGPAAARASCIPRTSRHRPNEA